MEQSFNSSYAYTISKAVVPVNEVNELQRGSSEKRLTLPVRQLLQVSPYPCKK